MTGILRVVLGRHRVVYEKEMSREVLGDHRVRGDLALQEAILTETKRCPRESTTKGPDTLDPCRNTYRRTENRWVQVTFLCVSSWGCASWRSKT